MHVRQYPQAAAWRVGQSLLDCLAGQQVKHNEQDEQGDVKQVFFDGSWARRDPFTTEQCGYQRDNEKNQGPFKHEDDFRQWTKKQLTAPPHNKVEHAAIMRSNPLHPSDSATHTADPSLVVL